MGITKACWCLSLNFGDVITPWLIEKITGSKPIYIDMSDKQDKFVVSGSILNWCDSSCHVWGAGIANSEDIIPKDINILATRGPISAERARECGCSCPQIYGDPALLMPKFYKSNSEKEYKLGIIPHYIDQAFYVTVADRLPPHRMINVFDPIEEVIEAIVSCEVILSSSLHGLIVADAYGVPSYRVKMTNRILGDGTKYQDYFASVELENYKPYEIMSFVNKSLGYCLRQLHATSPKIHADDLWNSCPFREM